MSTLLLDHFRQLLFNLSTQLVIYIDKKIIIIIKGVCVYIYISHTKSV